MCQPRSVQARGVTAETSNLAGRASDRVQADWRELKQGTEDIANNSTAAIHHRQAREAEEKAKVQTHTRTHSSHILVRRHCLNLSFV